MARYGEMDMRPLAQVPWTVSQIEFDQVAAEIKEGGACCVFVVADDIPANARSGYAALIVAYARAQEPVLLLENGAAALLIMNGGIESAQLAAGRMIKLLTKLQLEKTLRAGVAVLQPDVDASITAARTAANTATPGGVATAN